jgi:hypothetical protein
MGRTESGNRKSPLVGMDRNSVKHTLAVFAQKTIHYAEWYLYTT